MQRRNRAIVQDGGAFGMKIQHVLADDRPVVFVSGLARACDVHAPCAHSRKKDFAQSIVEINQLGL